ncbi:MAG: cytochrome [Streptosporangiaceae bacterium]|nr:cytochrome [Streptosporangiaceae bacterium]
MTDIPMPMHMRRMGFDPPPELAHLRADEGVLRVLTPFGLHAWLVTRYDDVRTVLSDPERFSNARTDFPFAEQMQLSREEIAQRRAGQLLGMDPPEHTRLRRMLTPEFTVRRIRRLAPRIEEIVDSHLDALEKEGPPADLVSEFALPIPSLVICELLGVPYFEREQFQRTTRKQLDLSVPMPERLQLQRESRTFMEGQVARATAAPGDDMLGMLIREHGDELTHDELVGVALLLLIAGHETTANMLGLGTLALLRHPQQLAAVRDDPAAVEPAVEELLRWLSIVPQGILRTTTTEVTLAGQTVPAGELVAVSLLAANHDPALVEDPDRLDITRGAMGHVAFGHGLHHCLGAPLARMEMRTAFPALLRRFPNLGLAVPFEEVPFRPHHFIHGLQSLPATW